MRIEQNNQYLTLYGNTQKKTENTSKNAQTFYESIPEETATETVNDKSTLSPLYAYTKFNNLTPTETDDTENIDTEISDTDAKWEAMDNLLKKLGINGKVSEMNVQTVPQNLSMYYIETEDDSKNMLILEFENGELLFTETDKNSKDLFYDYEINRTFLGLADDKLSVDELKKIFAKYFNVNELKDLILEFSDSKKDYSLNPSIENKVSI